MGKAFFILVLGAAACAALARPWVGVAAVYFVAILTPHAVWWWNFIGLRPALWVTVPTLVGFVIASLQGRINWKVVGNRRFAFLLVLWLFLTLSYYFGPYVNVQSPYRFTEPEWGFSTYNKIILLCVVAFCCIDDIRKLRVLVAVFIGSALYLTYWANDQYLSGRVFGRLAGPVDVAGSGTYADENSFAMLFVVACPFFWFAGQLATRKWVKWGLWLAIPFAWHGSFLTASRAGLLGIGVTTMLIAFRSKNKMLALLLIPALAGAYVWQAGDLMRERAGTISDTNEGSSASRLQAWNAALGMIAAHPVIGVGMNSFGPAFPDFSDKKPREAHNTVLQIAAESGAVAGSMYLLLVVTSIVALSRNGKRLKKQASSAQEHELYYMNEAILVSFIGMVVCSVFASLQMYEIFYFFLVLINAVLYCSAGQDQVVEAAQPRTRRPSPYGALSSASTQPGGSGVYGQSVLKPRE